jgi:hypothetical protein
MNGAGAELSELSRQLAEAKGQRDASQVGARSCTCECFATSVRGGFASFALVGVCRSLVACKDV